ncbi:hypothetical protein F4802DRAFT_359807 [Xylaria palmicola]|nr:hypothetical protein F4802DRAFT_359807 [Xylaria palmicola]
MTTPSPTIAPSLPADWAPTASGCLRTDDYWVWEFDAAALDARTVLGGPSQTTNCFASTWNPTVTYEGSGCPPQYTSACRDTEFGAVTCCPSAYDFTCEQQTRGPGVHAEWFRCWSKYDDRDTVVVTRTDFRQNTIAMETRTRRSYEHLFALALMYTTPASTNPSLPTSSPTSTPDPSETASPSPGEKSSELSAGAAAGIGVGAAVAVILLGLLAWFIYRRRKTAQLSKNTPQPQTIVPPMAYSYPTDDPRSVSQYPDQPPIAMPPPKELPATESPRFELQGDSHIR